MDHDYTDGDFTVANGVFRIPIIVQGDSVKKVLIFFAFIVAAYLILWSSFKVRFDESNDNVNYFDGFNDLDRESWFVGQWDTHEIAYSSAFVEDGVVRLPVTLADKGPYLLSKPFSVEGFEVVKVKRRAKISPGDKYFAGGMAIFETDAERMRPDATNAFPFGNALLLVEYVNGELVTTSRPGESTFRVLTPGWQNNGSYLLIEPEFDTWITEEIYYNLKTGEVKYTLNGKAYTLTSVPMAGKYLRLWMHSFGHFTGHQVTVDSVEITLKPKAELEEDPSD